MSYMADKDHIAITSRDASTTTRKFLYRDARLLRRSLSLSVSLATLIVASRPDWEICPGKYRPDLLGTQSASSYETAGLIKLRNRLVTAEIRGVSQHCRMVTYQNAARRSAR